MKRIESPLFGASPYSRLLAPVFCILSFWASDVFAMDHVRGPRTDQIRNPRVGITYVFSARLAAVDANAKTFTVRGIVDDREHLTLSVRPYTKLLRAGQSVALEDGRIGEAISGSLTMNVKGKIVALTTKFGVPLPPPLPSNRHEVNGVYTAGRMRDPIRGFVGPVAMPQR